MWERIPLYEFPTHSWSMAALRRLASSQYRHAHKCKGESPEAADAAKQKGLYGPPWISLVTMLPQRARRTDA